MSQLHGAAATSSGVEGIDDTYPVWDPTAGPTTDDILPLTLTREFSGSVVRRDLACRRLLPHVRVLTGSDEECTKLPTYASDPGDVLTPSGTVRMLRVIIVVTWDSKVR